ncbi:MAG: bifunctional metallophosphatase/5'-nucleotidase [Desulfobacterales bacterium]|nr:bifunctional metallophosphatase/5'-nucleotidase [Desulfobacterales bacterium]
MATRRKTSVFMAAIALSLTAVMLLFQGAALAGWADSIKDQIKPDLVEFTILQTSDVHNHASGYGPFLDYTPGDPTDEDGVLGGYARLATLVTQVRVERNYKNIPVVLLDSGDFLMGTVYDITASNPIMFKFFSLMNYDAVTLGNHEFDWAPAGLAQVLGAAVGEGFNLPIVASNTITSDESPDDDALEYFFNTGAIVTSKIIDLPEGVKIGLLGLLGPEADSKTPVAPPVTFNHDYAFIQGLVNDLRNNQGANLVVVMSHGGVRSDGTGDDENLALNVQGIDIIASGHYHTPTNEVFQVGDSNTIIFSPGEYGTWLSRLDVVYSKSAGGIDNFQFNLIPVVDTIPGDPIIMGMVDTYHAVMNESLAPMGVALEAPISWTDFPLEMKRMEETGLGNLCADSVRAVATSLAPLNDGNPYHVGVVASGVIRDNLYPGKTGLISFADIYGVLPLGISPDTAQPVPGYPLMSLYLTAPDLRNVCEAGVTLSAMMNDGDYFLNVSGIRFDYNPGGAPFFMGVSAIYLAPLDDFITASPGTAIDLTDTTTLYHATVDLYALQMLGVLTGMGLQIIPRDAAGNPIDPADYMAHRIDSDIAPGVQELKEWAALLSYLGSSFPADAGGIPAAVYGENGVGMGRVNVIMP